MAWPTESELDDLVARFSNATLSASEWTHPAHLVTGLWHATTFSEADALNRMRAGILRLNASHGTPNTDTRGYHETITRAYLVLLTQFARVHSDLALVPMAQTLLASDLAKRDALLSYYSRDVLNVGGCTARVGGAGPELLGRRNRWGPTFRLRKATADK